MVINDDLSSRWLILQSFRAASTAFRSSGLVMVCHGGTVQGTIGIDRHLTGGVGDLLNTNNDFHFEPASYLISRPGDWQ